MGSECGVVRPTLDYQHRIGPERVRRALIVVDQRLIFQTAELSQHGRAVILYRGQEVRPLSRPGGNDRDEMDRVVPFPSHVRKAGSTRTWC